MSAASDIKVIGETRSAIGETRSAIDCVNSFNRRTKLLAVDLSQRHKSDVLIWRAKERAMTVINYNPTFVMEIVGEYLFQYRDKIYEGDESFFLENDYDAELKAGVKEEKVDQSRYIIPKVKETWKTLTDKDKESYWALVNGLLDDYVDYLIAKKMAAKVSKASTAL
jgi:hypothetical protein